MTATLHIMGMTCAHCANHVKEALLNIAGIKSVKVDLRKKTAVIKYNENIPESALREAVDEAGYTLLK